MASSLINLEAHVFDSVRAARPSSRRGAARPDRPHAGCAVCQERRLQALAHELAELEAARGTALPHEYEPASAELAQVATTNHKLKYQLNHLKKVSAAERAGQAA